MKPVAPIVLAALLARSNASAADEDLRALRESAAASKASRRSGRRHHTELRRAGLLDLLRRRRASGAGVSRVRLKATR